jgi:hypothetical protein
MHFLITGHTGFKGAWLAMLLKATGNQVSGISLAPEKSSIFNSSNLDEIFENNIIQDKRAIGLLSYTSLYDAFYRANSCKVRNLIVSHALDKNLFYNSLKKEEKEEDKMEGKYPGALVLNPKRGLVNPILNFEEFCKSIGVEDDELINISQNIIDENFDAVYIHKDIDRVNFDV